MLKPTILNPEQRFQLQCGRCKKTIFVVVVDPTGVVCTCQGCFAQYKLESVGGVHVTNA